MTKIIWIVALLFSVVVSKDMDPKKLESFCNSGYIVACFSLGVLYERGEGVKQNYQKAAELYQKSCDGGNIGGCLLLGALYLKGEGVKKKYQKEEEL